MVEEANLGDGLEDEIEALKKEALDERNEPVAEKPAAPENEPEVVAEPIIEPEAEPPVEPKSPAETEPETTGIEIAAFTPIEIMVDGRTITVDSIEELTTLAQANGSTNKAYSRNDDLLAQANISEQDIQLLADAKQGNAQAISALATKFGIDALSLEEDAGYQPQFVLQERSEVEAFADSILANPALETKYKAAVADVDQGFLDFVHGDVNRMKLFAGHVEAGTATPAINEAYKISALQRIPLQEAYILAYNKQNVEVAPVVTPPVISETPNRVVTTEEQAMRKLAGLENGGNKQPANTETDVFAMSDEDFAEHKRTLQDSQA